LTVQNIAGNSPICLYEGRFSTVFTDRAEDEAKHSSEESRKSKRFLRSSALLERKSRRSGIVYHASYLRFIERGRTNHSRLMGADQHALFAQARCRNLAGRGERRLDQSGAASAAKSCWSRPRCGSPSSAKAGRSRSRKRFGCNADLAAG
jgi:hypothetical protein